MSRCFVDTSGWVSLFIPTESFHSLASRRFTEARQRGEIITTTNYVVTELVALLGSRHRIPRNNLFQYIDSIYTAPFVELVHIDLNKDAIAWRLCKSRPDKNWSLVDCASFVVMEQFKIQQALTTDQHFEQAGFTRLLK